MSTPILRLVALVSFALCVCAFALACGDKSGPVQPVYFADGRLNMAISDQWVLQKDNGKKAYWRHGVAEQIKLTFRDETSDYGNPMSVQQVRGMIGSELNLKHGGVNARLGLGGVAVLSYKKKVKENGEEVFTQNWVVASPFGAGAVARVAITLKVPDGQQGTPEFQALVESLDKQVGDAKMPRA